MKQTTVEWLENEMTKKFIGGILPKSFLDLFEQAKEMEKQQIKDAYTIPYMLKDDFEQYYNETYKPST